MTSVNDYRRNFQSNYYSLNTPLLQLKFIGPYLNDRLAALGFVTIGDLARWARRKTTAQIHEVLSTATLNARANTCVENYHIADINTKGYNTLRNLLEAVKQENSMIFAHIPELPPLMVARDRGTSTCSCVSDRDECQALARGGICTWRNGRCQPRATSRPQAFLGAADLAGQHDSQGRITPGMRFSARWRVPDNR